MSEQRATRHDRGQRKINGWSLADLFAAPPYNAGTQMAQHSEPGGHLMQYFRHILVDDGICAATDTGAGTVFCRLYGNICRDGLKLSSLADTLFRCSRDVISDRRWSIDFLEHQM